MFPKGVEHKIITYDKSFYDQTLFGSYMAPIVHGLQNLHLIVIETKR